MNYKEKHELSNKGNQLKSTLEELRCYNYRIPELLSEIESSIDDARKMTPFVASSDGRYLSHNLDHCLYIQENTHDRMFEIIRAQSREIELLTRMFEDLFSGIITAKED